MKFPILAALALAIAAPAAAEAQRDDQFVWGIAGGATIPSGSAKDNHKTGPHGTIMFGIGGVDSPFGVRFDGQYALLGDRGDEGLAVDQGEARVFSLMGHGVISLYGSNRKLYALGGLGGFWYNPDGQGTTAVNDFALAAGLGMFFTGLNGFVEVKFQNFYRALPDPVTGLKGKKSAQLFPVTLGIMF
jgi:hypothetical protein